MRSNERCCDMKNEKQIENNFIKKLKELKYIYREDIKDKTALEENFRTHFQNLNRVRLSDSEFSRLKESVITSDVFTAAKILRETNTFKRDDDTPLQYTLVNTVDWCKNEYEVVNQLRINTENSYHRYDVMILINGIPVVQIELKSLGVGRISYVFEQIGIDDTDTVARIVNILSHKTVFRYEMKEMVPDNVELFIDIFDKIQKKYNFVIHGGARNE